MNQQGRAFSTASIIFTAGVGSTLGLALLGQDVVIFNCSNIAAVVRGRTFFNLAFCCYLHHQFFNRASVPGGRFSNPPTTPSPARQTVKKLFFF
jgi:hypothetical protein